MFDKLFHNLEEGYTTSDMAVDLAAVMYKLEIVPAQVIGISQGGMIALWLAILISFARQNDTIQQTVGNWIRMVAKKKCEYEGKGMLCEECAEKHPCGENMVLPLTYLP